MISKICINVAYERILAYDFIGNPIYYDSNSSNLDIFEKDNEFSYHNGIVEEIESEFQIKFPYKIKISDTDELKERLGIFSSEDFTMMFDQTYNVFKTGEMKMFIEKKEKFIYPILLKNQFLFEKTKTIELPNDLVISIKNEMAKLVFVYHFEGNFGMIYNDYKWLSDLSLKYNFKKTDVIIINGNLASEEKFKQLVSAKLIYDNFTIYPFSWFSHNILFVGGWKLNEEIKSSCHKSFYSFLENNRNKKKMYHFLCFNRIPKIHRICIFGELMTNPNFKDKFITSLGKSRAHHSKSDLIFFESVNGILSNDYKYSKDRLLTFFKNYNSNNNTLYDYDFKDLRYNTAINLNVDAHSNCFVNIVNESLIDNNCVFFSEKTFKPIYCCQPFILFGNPYSLKKLKEMGYKTFDKWWDESYDLEVDFTKKLEKIIDVMTEISSWSMEKCFIVTNEMESILKHNFDILMSDEETIKLYDFLDMGTIKKYDDIDYQSIEVIDIFKNPNNNKRTLI